VPSLALVSQHPLGPLRATPIACFWSCRALCVEGAHQTRDERKHQTQGRKSSPASSSVVTFHNEDNASACLRVTARGKRDPITVVGICAVILRRRVYPSERRNGPTIARMACSSARGFLKATPPRRQKESKNISVRDDPWHWSCYARKLVQAFRCPRFDVIEPQPHRLRESCRHWTEARRWDCCGLGGTAGDPGDHDLPAKCPWGLAQSRAVRITRRYGADAIQVISEDPYRARTRHKGHRL